VKAEHANARQAHRSQGKARYVGVAKNDFDANRIAAANNLQFLDRMQRAEEQAAPSLQAELTRRAL